MKSIDNDIRRALDIIESKEYSSIGDFHADSPIYKGTNENINSEPYIKALKDNERVLTIVGSGDQVLNSILYGAKEIDAYDISSFPKYYLDLKIAAIKELKFGEYLNFIYGPDYFDDEVFNRVLKLMPKDSSYFWKEITKDSYPLKVYNSFLFSLWSPSQRMAIDMNPFLTPKNYSLVKNRLDQVKLKYIDGDIYKIGESLDKEYDLINLSNIGMYADKHFGDTLLKDSCIKHSNFVKNLRISPNGKVLNYLLDVLYSKIAMIYDSIVYEEKGFDVQYISNYSTGSSDAVAIYRKHI